ncbi:MAG: M14 family metallocarboxypeptidase [Verrucomicrobiota bacterium]
MPQRVNVDQLIRDLSKAGSAAGFEVATYGATNQHPLIAMSRAGSSKGGRKIYISSGIHGDEPAGPLALLDILQKNELPAEDDIYLCPLMNPDGLAAGKRENAKGMDLNRDYSDFRSLEIAAHQQWVSKDIQALDLALHLHEDWEATGFYLYELNFSESPGLADVMLSAAARFLPIEQASEIDGHPANSGIIRPEAPPEDLEGLPEAVYIQTNFNCLNYTLETPSGLELDQRIAAQRAVILAALKI